MRKKLFCIVCFISVITTILIACNQKSSPETNSSMPAVNADVNNYGGYESQVKWGGAPGSLWLW